MKALDHRPFLPTHLMYSIFIHGFRYIIHAKR
uniref:Uncharacterized protein n=1 Tax=Arundo donax TaxID=35708 RepID=A0A0A9HG90_ARUDO